ncbi:hypothetical protein RUND412_007782 [Rhizina undulata]
MDTTPPATEPSKASEKEKERPTQALLNLAFPPALASEIYSQKIERKPLYLTRNPLSTPSADARAERRKARAAILDRKRSKKPQPLSAKEKRALGVHEIPKSAAKYGIYEPLWRLWVGYVQEILGIIPGTVGGGASSQTAAKLVSADFHGAYLEVVRSRCVGRVGVKGICVKETRGLFVVVTERDQIKHIPKEHTVFRFSVPFESAADLPVPSSSSSSPSSKPPVGGDDQNKKQDGKLRDMVFEIHGSQFMYRPAERAGRKFKQKPLLDL